MLYCGQTMKRQLEANEHELKDWCVNALTLSEAYLAREHFAQAEYLLYAAHNIIPESEAEQVCELKAMIQAGIGRYYGKRLEIGVVLYINSSTYIKDKVNEKFVDFPSLNLNWPTIEDLCSLGDAKSLFRLANTQFKKAMDFYVLDGFVTEHVTAKQAISQCYKFLCKVELDQDRVEMMHGKRVELIETMQRELNPNTYQVRMMEFGAELSDIYSELYESELKKAKKNA